MSADYKVSFSYVPLPKLDIVIACCFLYCLTASENVLNAVTLQIHLKSTFMVLKRKIAISYVLQKTHVSEEMGEI